MLLMIGGTRESAEIATAMLRATSGGASLRIFCTISVATEAARSLYPVVPYLQVRVGRMDAREFAAFLQREKIVAVIDASHPFAVEVSQNAIAATAAVGVPYLRYEREGLDNGQWTMDNGQFGVPLEVASGKSTIANPKSEREIGRWGDGERATTNYELRITNYDELLAGNYLEGKRVLLAVGCKVLPLFRAWQERATLFARILPAVNSLEVALEAGFSSDRIVALRPPVSAELEAALWQQWQISLVVAKASGKAGGEDVKRAVAQQLGIPLIIIARPAIAYPQQTSDLKEALSFCCQFVK